MGQKENTINPFFVTLKYFFERGFKIEYLREYSELPNYFNDKDFNLFVTNFKSRIDLELEKKLSSLFTIPLKLDFLKINLKDFKRIYKSIFSDIIYKNGDNEMSLQDISNALSILPIDVYHPNYKFIPLRKLKELETILKHCIYKFKVNIEEFTTLVKFFMEDYIDDFLRYEQRLINDKYLDLDRNWIHKKEPLIAFILKLYNYFYFKKSFYLSTKDSDQEKTKNKLLLKIRKFFESRYNKNLEQEFKPSRRNKIKTEGYFHFIENKET